MEERVKKIMSDIFQVNIKEVNEYSCPDSIKKWDSLGHLNLITAIEEEFEIILNEEQITQMLNFKLVIEIISECLETGK